MSIRSHIHRFRLAATIALACLCCLPTAAAPQVKTTKQAKDSEREYRIKSAFLYHFLHYGEWTRDAAPDNDELVVCVAGNVPYAAALQTLGEKRLEGRPVIVQHVDETVNSRECRIAFFGASSGPVAEETLHRLRKEGVLTVGETAAFTELGGMIRLYQHRNRIRFEIKLEAVRSAGIHISSRVLQLATIV